MYGNLRCHYHHHDQIFALLQVYYTDTSCAVGDLIQSAVPTCSPWYIVLAAIERPGDKQHQHYYYLTIGGLGFGVWCVGFGVWGFVFGVWGWGL